MAKLSWKRHDSHRDILKEFYWDVKLSICLIPKMLCIHLATALVMTGRLLINMEQQRSRIAMLGDLSKKYESSKEIIANG